MASRPTRRSLVVAGVIVGVVVLSLLAVWAARVASGNVDAFLSTGTGPWQTDQLIDVLEERGSTAARLEAELRRVAEVPEREPLLERVRKKRRKIDRLGAERRDRELLDFLVPQWKPTRGVADAPAARDEQRRVVGELLELIQSPTYLDSFTDRRVEAVHSLAYFPGDDGLEALIRVLSDPNESDYLKRAVVESLEQIDDYRARRALEEHRSGSGREERPAVRATVAEGRSSRELSSASVSVRRRAIETLAAQPGGDPVDGLISALDDPDPELRALAVRALGQRDDTKAERALLRVLENVRARAPLLAAAQALKECREPQRRALLAANAGAALESHRSFLVGALAECDHEDVVEPILDAMQSRDETVALAARNALLTQASRRHHSAVGPLIDNLSMGRPAEVERSIVEVLERLTGQRLGNDVARWIDWWLANSFDFQT